MSYQIIINTDNYRHRPCSKKNWEPGTINDYMLAINGWKTIEKSLKEVAWRIEMFFGGLPYSTHYNKEYEDYNRFWKWFNQKKNNITYRDRLCGIDRSNELRVYGIAQGYVSAEKCIEELNKSGTVKIQFSEAYDIRQRGCKIFKGCFMEITAL